MNLVKLILVCIIAYFIGNFQSGILISRQFGVADIRKLGSGGTGTTNVLRNLGFLPSIIVFVCDMLKGALGVLIGRWLGADVGAALGGIFAIVGHNWPVIFGFKGGKGVATSLGAIIALEPQLGLIMLVAAILLIAIIRIVSVVSILGTLIAAVVLVVINPGNWAYVFFAIGIFLMVLYSHRENIQRLKNGTERKLDFQSILNKSKRR